MPPEIDQEIDPRYYNYKPPPESHEILTVLITQLTDPAGNIKLPLDEQKLAEGLLAAVKEVTGTGLRRFVEPTTGQLTDAAQTTLKKLKAGDNPVLVTEGEFLTIPPGMVDTVKSKTRMAFSNPGIVAFRQAAEVASRVWFPQ